ncbi:MAG: redoxin domain-containing protein [Verrucomicrobiales bacterium]|nr:redoxin domain-containing protein [Verrucomicrobiales bacterium]MCP5528412.1 redoxin domain-containing protein [Verrucomicrobiales bacterium]
MKHRLIASLLPALAAGCLATAAAELGIPAPSLQISEWVKGTPQNLADGKGKGLYVVEFWATWCPPCRTSIPHLTDVQKEFKQDHVTVIGISDEAPAKVRSFVESLGDKMDYVVAIDDARKTSADYMKAFGQGGIPHAFIVDREGRIAWHGHPMAGLDLALKQMIAGTYDIAETRRALAAESRLRDYLDLVSAESLPAEAASSGAELVQDLKSNPGALNTLAWAILTHPRIKHRDLALARQAAKLAYDATGGKDAAITDTYARAMFDSGNPTEAIRLQKEAVAACADENLRAQLQAVLAGYEDQAR